MAAVLLPVIIFLLACVVVSTQCHLHRLWMPHLMDVCVPHNCAFLCAYLSRGSYLAWELMNSFQPLLLLRTMMPLGLHR